MAGGLKEVIRAEKQVTDWGTWNSGVRMPSGAFPLSKQRKFRVGASHRWRIAKFLCGATEYRLLVTYRPQLEDYRCYLGRYKAGDTCLVARFEYHGTHPGWHLHADCEGGKEVFGLSSVGHRLPRVGQHHRNAVFGVESDEKAFFAAAEKFGLISATGLGQL